MATNNAIREILEGYGTYLTGRGDWQELDLEQAESALLALLLSVQPDKEGWYSHVESNAKAEGYNEALDQWEANIKQVFGEDK